MKADDILKEQGGAALIIALMMMVLITLISLSAIFTESFENRLSEGKGWVVDPLGDAESGTQVTPPSVSNFDSTEKYVDDRYNSFTDPKDPDPNANRVTEHSEDRRGTPGGLGLSARNLD